MTAALTAVLWAAWLSSYGAWKANPDVGVGHIVASQGLMMAAGVGSLVMALQLVVVPGLAHARVWREIGYEAGVQDAQERCGSCPFASGAATNIVPLRFNGQLGSVQNRGN